MNIGIDIDDTITETYSTIIPMVAVKYDLDLGDLIRTKPSYKTLEKSLVNYDSFMAEYFPTMAKIVPLKKDVIEVLNKLRNDGHKIIFITARNRLEYKDPFMSSPYIWNAPNVLGLVQINDKLSSIVWWTLGFASGGTLLIFLFIYFLAKNRKLKKK